LHPPGKNPAGAHDFRGGIGGWEEVSSTLAALLGHSYVRLSSRAYCTASEPLELRRFHEVNQIYTQGFVLRHISALDET